MPDHFRQERTDKMGPSSPAGSDSPLSLVLPQKTKSLPSPHSRPMVHGKMVRGPQQSHAQHPSPHHSSSGYSEPRSSPDRSPYHHHHHHQTGHSSPVYCPVPVAHNGRSMAQLVCDESDEAPLSLVVDKTKFVSDDSGHEDGSSGQNSPFRGGSPHQMPEDYSVAIHRKISHDQESHREMIQPNVTIAKVSDDTAIDLSEQHHNQQEQQQQQQNEDYSSVSEASTCIKIKDFAKITESEPSSDQAIRSQSMDHEVRPIGSLRKSSLSCRSHGFAPQEDMSDLTSEVSSIDTWTSSLLDQNGHPQPTYRQIKTANGEIIFPCDFCDKAFVNRYHLQSHIVTHTGERNFECHKCGKSFGRKSTLRAHMTTHTKTSNFMCPMCEKACNDNNSLEEHIRMHTGEKPFVCSICSKAYARKSHLNVHYRVHTGERPFVCTDCGKDFTEKRFLNDHMQTAHSGQNGPLKCPNCFREFAYKTSLKQHLKKQMCVKNMNRGQGGSSHGAHAKQFQCPFCEKSYSWKQTLKQHVSMYHRNKVHTDEFWKYELAKHRRVGVDLKTNEDMWQKQLGKHAEDGTPLKGTGSHRSPSMDESNHEERWLDQIHARTNSTDQAKVAAEMKALALQSMDTLTLVKMRSSTSVDQAQPTIQVPVSMAAPMTKPKIKLEPELAMNIHEERKSTHQAPHQTQQSYMDLLAQIRASNENSDKTSSSQYTPPSSTPSLVKETAPALTEVTRDSLPALPDIKEEPAAKRTQMWLAQLGNYKEKTIQEDLDRNHDELWEEQIARVRKNAIQLSAPRKAVEIVLDDDASSTDSHPVQGPFPLFPHTYRYSQANHIQIQSDVNLQPAKLEVQAPKVPHQRPRIVPLMSALELHPSPITTQAVIRPKGFPSATITSESKTSGSMALPKPNYPGLLKDDKMVLEKDETEDEENKEEQVEADKRLTLPLEHNIPDALPPTPPSKEQRHDNQVCAKDLGEPIEEPSSFLKLILLDPSARKRLNSNDYGVVPPKKKSVMETEETNDILRRRLLGMKEPQSPSGHSAQNGESKTTSHSHSLGSQSQVAPTSLPATTSASGHPTVRPTGMPAPNLHLLCPQMPTVPFSNRAISKIQTSKIQLQIEVNANNNNNNCSVAEPLKPKDPNEGDEGVQEDLGQKRSDGLTPYAHTSVLKHLLHRYTESDHPEDQ